MKKTTKRVFSVLLAVLMLLSAAPLTSLELHLPATRALVPTAKASDYLTSGYCGDPLFGDVKDIEWTIDENGVLTLSGHGRMGSAPNAQDNRVKEVIVGEQITSIAGNAFYDCQNLQKVTLSSTVTSIGSYAFSGCISLTEIDFGGVSTIGTYAFANCTGLVELTLNNNLTLINNYAFNKCSKLTSLNIPGSVRTIGAYAFNSCSNLSALTLNEGLVRIMERAFWAGQSKLTGELRIPDSCKTIEKDAFSGQPFTSVYIGAGLQTFAQSTLNKLTTIEVSENNEYFSSFDGVLYTKDYSTILLLPQKTTLNVPSAFNVGSNIDFLRRYRYIEEINIPEEHATHKSVDGIIYSKNGEHLVFCPTGRVKDVVIEAGTKTIDNRAFDDCRYITSVAFADSVTGVGYQSFFGCMRLETLYLSAELLTISAEAFRGCGALTSVELPNKLQTIGKEAFSHNALSGTLTIPDSCITIDQDAFISTHITKLHIGKSLQSFGAQTRLDQLQEITVDEENTYFSVFDGCLYPSDFSKLLLVPPRTVLNLPEQFGLQIRTYGFEQYYNFLSDWGFIENVTIEDGNPYYQTIDGLLYSADGKTVIGCPLSHNGIVHVADGVETVGITAFYGCRQVTEVYLPESVSVIKRDGFYACGLTKLQLPEYMDVIEGNAFASCQGLTEIVLPKGVDTYYFNTFFGCHGLESLVFPEGTTTIKDEAITYCNNLKTIVFPSSLQTVSFLSNSGNSYQLQSLDSLTVNNRYTKLYHYGTINPLTTDSTIYAYCGSPAHDMAIKRLFKFESLGHTWLDWYVYEPATYEHDGIERRDCAYCDGYEERVIPKLHPDTYTATFVADGTVVASVDFQKGATSVEEPAVPARDRYTGRWEDYTLNDEDITVNAVYTLIQSGDVSEIETESSVTLYEEKENVLFRLKAWSDAKTVKSVVSQSIPLDIVLVVDQSGSMDDTLGGSVKKVDALKDAANSFIESVAANAEMTGADHRIAIAGFGLAGNYTGYLKNENTELLTSPRGILGYADITPADYAGALVSISEKQTLLDAVASIEARGATAADLGLEMAKGVFSNTDSTGRERVVVFMTDGEPTYTNGFQTSVANSAVYNAKLLKNAYGALVYSVGVFGTAESGSRNVKAFMNAVSSNYPNAGSYTNLGTQVSDAFFITANHTDALTGIFRTITTESLSHTAPFENVTLIKTLSPYVTLSAPQEEALRVEVMRKYGISNDQISVSKDGQGRTVIRIDGLTPYEVTDDNGNVTYEVAVEFFASLNENASAAGTYTVDTDDSGIMLNGAIGYEAVFGTGEITLTSGKNRYIFTINGEVYEITEGGNISSCVPETDFAPDWQFSGWNLTGVQSANGVIVDASLIKAPRTVIWHTDTEDVQQIYVQGDILTPPAVAERADGSAFLSWNRSLPTVMPDSDLDFTAVYGPHIHRYESDLTVRATCTADGLLTYTCKCGDTYEETVPALGHNYEALTASTDNDDSRCTFVCTNCGDRYDYALTYQVTSASNHRGRILYEFNLTNDDLETGFQPDGSVDVRVPLSDFQNTARNVYVYRNVNGVWEPVPARLENGYLVITADHFTPYDVRFVFSCSETGEHDWGEGEITLEPTCAEQGNRHYICSLCEAEKDEPIDVDPDNHADYGTEIENAAAATCYRDGYTGDTVCARCRAVLLPGETISRDTVAHTWDNGVVTKEATCTEVGTRLYTCTTDGCGATKEETVNVDPDAHAYSVTVTEPTCTEGGYTTYACTLCTHSYTADETGPLGHTFAIRVTPATCRSGGFTTCTCTRCTYSFTKDPTPKADHVDNDRDGWCDYGCGTAVANPDDGSQGQSDSGDKCPLCGETHTGFFGGIIGFFHRIAYFFRHLFG